MAKILSNYNGLEVVDAKARETKVNLPTDASGKVQNGTQGQFLVSNGDGTTAWQTITNGNEVEY